MNIYEIEIMEYQHDYPLSPSPLARSSTTTAPPLETNLTVHCHVDRTPVQKGSADGRIEAENMSADAGYAISTETRWCRRLDDHRKWEIHHGL
jgi:hypothetical protein